MTKIRLAWFSSDVFHTRQVFYCINIFPMIFLCF